MLILITYFLRAMSPSLERFVNLACSNLICILLLCYFVIFEFCGIGYQIIQQEKQGAFDGKDRHVKSAPLLHTLSGTKMIGIAEELLLELNSKSQNFLPSESTFCLDALPCGKWAYPTSVNCLGSIVQ